MTLFYNFTRQEGPPETAPDARRAKDNGKSKYGTTNQSNMKTKKSGILILFLCIFCVVSCDNGDKKGREVTDYKEYILTVASGKVPGVLTSDGHNYLTDVYAVKKSCPMNGFPSAISKDLTLKKNFTEHYKNQYPDAGVKTVVVSFTIDI